MPLDVKSHESDLVPPSRFSYPKGTEIYGPDFELVSYRDYLLSIWISIAKKANDLRENSAIKQLNLRFHQNFRVTDTNQVTANELLIPIMVKILTSAVDEGYGFGISETSIKDIAGSTPRKFLDYLISLTKLPIQELSLRYRLNLERPDSSLSSPVLENIATLQMFFHDGFQGDPDPFPIIPDKCQYKSPFFLEYGEWLNKQTRFCAENFYEIQKSIDFGKIGYVSYARSGAGDEQFVLGNNEKDSLSPLDEQLKLGHQHYNLGVYRKALEHYNNAMRLLWNLLEPPSSYGGPIRPHPFIGATAEVDPTSRVLSITSLESPPGSLIVSNAQRYFPARQKAAIRDIADLDHFTNQARFGASRNSVHVDDIPYERNQYALIYLAACVMPTVLGDTAVASGDYFKAIYYYSRLMDPKIIVGMANLSNTDGYKDWSDGYPHLYFYGLLPYTFDSEQVKASTSRIAPEDTDSNKINTSWDVLQKIIHPMERIFFSLRLGNAMLEWADLLYLTDDPSNLARARELYKAVLYLHGETPPINPDWNPPDVESVVADRTEKSYITFHDYENPAVTLQKSRARKGFAQLEMGLNYYGYHEDMVPTLRYRPLKDAADSLVSSAKQAQTDFLNYLGKVEDALLERILISNLLQKASLETDIAAEQEKIAEFSVTQATDKVKEIERQIQAKEDEINAHDDLFTQFKDYVTGFKDALSSIPDVAKSYAASGVSSEISGEAVSVEASEGLATGVAAGAGIMTGYALFIYCSYVSISGMADAANKRQADLSTLRDKVLPAAQEFVSLKGRDLKIASLHKAIAQSDADLAHNLIAFQTLRFLNKEFWSILASVSKRVMHRYLDLSAKNGWLAERALSYEQDRPIDIMRFGYFPLSLQGVTGADQLQSDLAELEASRINYYKKKIPIKHSFSLMRDFPLAFGQLKKTGKCQFRTEELPFRFAYPGTYGYRIRNITVAVESSNLIMPSRGILTNQGISVISDANGGFHLSVRPSEALPLSEFRMRKDMLVFNLPNEALSVFEGSGVETFWTLEFPSAANPYGLDNVTDIMLTFDVQVHFSINLYKSQIVSMPRSIQRLVFVSALKYQPKQVSILHSDKPIANIDFNISSVGLPIKEFNRKIKNLVIFLIGYGSPAKMNATFRSNTPPLNSTIKFEKGIALSNAYYLADSPAKPLPLNSFVDMDANQIFELTLKKSENPGVSFSKITDIVLGVEYSADLSI